MKNKNKVPGRLSAFEIKGLWVSRLLRERVLILPERNFSLERGAPSGQGGEMDSGKAGTKFSRIVDKDRG